MHANIVSLEWLQEHLQDHRVKIVDCRFVLGNPTAGIEAYQEGHIPGAVYMDLEEDLSGPKQAHGGRHPLPDWEIFAKKLGQAGIDEQMTIVAYDDQGGAMASRLWWMLKYLGHEKVWILNEGYSQWVKQGYPVTTDIPAPQPGTYQPQIQEHLLMDMEGVKGRKEGVVLLDSREEKRYLGMEEPIDPVAGHIPGAKNFFWKDSLKEDGTWKSPEELKERFDSFDLNQEFIVYCGSGVTACPNIVALNEAGFKQVKLYAGSWSDWCSYKENPVAVDQE